MTNTSATSINRKDIAKIIITSLLVCAIMFGISWVQMFAFYAMNSIYAIVIVLVAPIISLYLNHRNSLISDHIRIIDRKRLVAISGIAVATVIALYLIVQTANWVSFNILDMALVAALIPVASLVSLYFDYSKIASSGDSSKHPSIIWAMMAGILATFVIAFACFDNFEVLSLLSIMGIIALTTLAAPLVSLYLDNKNPAIGIKNRKFSRNKAIITIAVGFLVIISILLTAFVHLMLYL